MTVSASQVPAAPAVGPRPRLDEIDGLRAVACLMVLVFHTWEFADLPQLSRWMGPLTAGVDVFIVLSGFCLFLPVAANPERFSARRFWKQRIRRIVPAYYASMVFVCLMPEMLVILWRLAGRQAKWQPIPDAVQWITHLTFTHTFSTRTWDGLSGVYWSLGLEAQFYLAMPVVVWLFARYRVKGLLAIAALSTAWNTGVALTLGTDSTFNPAHFLWQANLFGRWVEFAAGTLAAYCVHLTRSGQLRLAPRIRFAILAVGTGVTAYCLFGNRVRLPLPLGLIVLSSGLCLVLIGLSTMPQEKPLLVTRVMRVRPLWWLGTISYSFYLIHQPLEWFFSRLLLLAGSRGYLLWAAQLTLGTGVVALFAWGGYRLFERPFLGSTHSRRPKPVADESTQGIGSNVGAATSHQFVQLRDGSQSRLNPPTNTRVPGSLRDSHGV